jgi:hypothetical protein
MPKAARQAQKSRRDCRDGLGHYYASFLYIFSHAARNLAGLQAKTPHFLREAYWLRLKIVVTSPSYVISSTGEKPT